MNDEYKTSYWYVAKGVMDYIIITEKDKFTYEEIEEMIESKEVLNYINDMIVTLLDSFIVFNDIVEYGKPVYSKNPLSGPNAFPM